METPKYNKLEEMSRLVVLKVTNCLKCNSESNAGCELSVTDHFSTEKCMPSLNPEILGDRGQRGHSSEGLVQDPWQPVTSTVSYPYSFLLQSGGCGNTELIRVSLGVR